MSTYYQVWKMLAWSTQNRKSCIKEGGKQSTSTILSKYASMLEAMENFLNVFISLQSHSQCRVLEIASPFKTNSRNQPQVSVSTLIVYLRNTELLYQSSTELLALSHSSSKCRTHYRVLQMPKI